MKNLLKCLLLAVVIAFGLYMQSRAEAAEYIGNSQINMNDRFKELWDKYSRQFNKGNFLIKFEQDQITSTMQWACPGSALAAECNSEPDSTMMWRVKNSYGDGWKIFAKEGKIVWEGPVCYNGQNLNSVGSCQSSSVSSHTRSEELRKMGTAELCRNATTAEGNWTKLTSNKKYVNEVLSRGFTLEDCAKLTQSSSSSSSSRSDAPMSDKELCMAATSMDGAWEQNWQYKKYVNQAKEKTLTLGRCSALTGRPNPEASGTKNASTMSKDGQLDSIEVRLKKLKKLEDSGLITSSEAAAKRKEILKDM